MKRCRRCGSDGRGTGRCLCPSSWEWNRDPAASGWRSRAFASAGEVIVYDDGEWEVRLRSSNGQTCAYGKEVSVEASKVRALQVYRSLTKETTDAL